MGTASEPFRAFVPKGALVVVTLDAEFPRVALGSEPPVSLAGRVGDLRDLALDILRQLPMAPGVSATVR